MEISLRNKMEEAIYKSDLNKLEEFKAFIKPSDRILKLGAGLGFQTKMLSDIVGGNILIAEVENNLHPDINIPLMIYDGKKLPLPDNSFDISIANHVLHHTPDPKTVLLEMKRVSKTRIIIVEEVWTNYLQRVSLIANCWFKNRMTSGKPITIYPKSYLSEKKWLELFKMNGLQIESRATSWRLKKLFPFRVDFFVLNK